MKVSKILLQTIMVAITTGAITSCTMVEQVTEKDRTDLKKNPDAVKTDPGFNCLACGMG